MKMTSTGDTRVPYGNVCIISRIWIIILSRSITRRWSVKFSTVIRIIYFVNILRNFPCLIIIVVVRQRIESIVLAHINNLVSFETRVTAINNNEERC